MYHCHIMIYCVGCQTGLFRPLEAIAPLEAFTHSFSITDTPDISDAARAGLILADLRGITDAAHTVQLLAEAKAASTELILLAEQTSAFAAQLPLADDLWTLPMTDAELCFRFRRWQARQKLCIDHWETSQFLDAAINHNPSLIWFKDRDGGHEKVNDSFCQAVGKSRDQICGRGHSYIWDAPEDDCACADSDRKAMEAGTTMISDECIHTRKGERLLSTYKSPLYDWDGSVMGTIGVALDITQERAYKSALLEKTHTLEQVFTTMDCGIICHTVDGSAILNINRAALHILGYESQEELEADGFDTIAASVADEDKPLLRRCIQMLHHANDSATMEYRVCHKNGDVLHVFGNIKLVEEDGRWYYQRFLLDCTAQKLRDQAVHSKMNQRIKYQEQLFNIFSSYLAINTDDVYLMMNADATHVEYVSPNVERVLGILPDALEKDLCTAGRCLSGTPVTLEELRRMSPGQSMEPRETERINRQTGEHKWFRETVYCVALQNEKKIIAYISDRTQERQAHDDLLEALSMAQVANRAKSAFLSSVSHDIRTPMNSIMGFITLLREEANNPERVLEYTQRIDSASQHLLGLINDVLDMNKIESGTATLNLAGFRLADMIDEINTIIRPQARTKGQRFDIHTFSLTSEYLIGDRLRINQILINILSNAVKYTQRGGTITMTVTELPQVVKNYSRIRFIISDNGQGMSENYQKVIFTPFTREQDTGASQIQGTGLGMSITKSLVELMNGTIQLESALGHGSTFTVELELRIQEQAIDPKFWERHNIRRMIVVDDDPDACQSIVHSMSGTGVLVDSATDGAAAADMVCRSETNGQPYDLVLLDWKMPGMNGAETARLIRLKHSSRLPIMVFTAYDWDDIKESASEVGIRYFLPKPFFMSNFREAIRRLTGPKPQAAAAANTAVQGRRILVVDDIEVNRIILEKILGTRGAICDMAENGKQALDIFEASSPGTYDIIMMDIQMPVMDGYTAARAIRASKHPSAKAVAVIAMTANAFVDDVREALTAGMDAHIAKPIVMDKMMDTIQQVLTAKGN